MILLREYFSSSDASDDAKKLEWQGIPTHVSSQKSHSLLSIHTGAIKVGLWILLNHQHDDAVAYLNNNNHLVTTGLTEKQLKRLKKQASVSAYHYINKILIYTGTIAIVCVIIIFYLTVNNGQS